LLSLSSTISLSSCFKRLSASCSRFSASCSRFSASCSRLSLSSALICAPIVGCQFNFANQRRQGGKEERNADLLIDAELDAEEVDMAVRGEKSDQDDQTAADQGYTTNAVQHRQRLKLA
jgi:hypothetical protein